MRAFLFAICLASAPAAAVAAEWCVAPGGSDGAAGTVAAPFATLQRGVDAAQAGDTVWVRAGTYRQSVVGTRSGTAASPILIAAWPGEAPVVKGSLVVDGWVRDGAGWRRDGWTHASQMVTVDGVPLRQIGVPSAYYAGPASDGTTMIVPVGSGLADLVPGSFWYDATLQRLHVRLAGDADPSARLVEAAVARRLLFLDAATWVTVRGLAFRHSSTAAFQQGGAAIELGSNCTLERCDVQWCDFAGVAMGYRREGARVVDCVVSNHGNSGIGASASWGFSVLRSTLAGNNWRGFNAGWHAGGLKATSDAYGTIDRCEIADNAGQGVWFDYCDGGQPLRVTRNHIARNAARYGGGVMIEASRNALVANNLLIENDRRGIYVSASDDVMIAHNTVCGTRTQAAIDISGMPRAGKTLTDVTVRDNVVAGNPATHDLFLVRENGTDVARLTCDHNLFVRTDGSVALWSGADGRGGWAGTTYRSVAAWTAATALGDGCVQGDPRFAPGGYEPEAASPAVDAGVVVADVGDDHLGRSRPAGGKADLGAYERGGSGGTGGGTGAGSGFGTGGSSPSGITMGADGGSPTSGSGCGLGSGVALALLALALVLSNVWSWREK